jgi:hypothetical protein
MNYTELSIHDALAKPITKYTANEIPVICFSRSDKKNLSIDL